MKKDGFIKLPESELEVMQIVWDMEKDGCTDICAAAMFRYAPALERLKLTTVLTLIQRLIGKGFLSLRKNGRVNCYNSLVDETEYKNRVTRDFIETVYKNNASGLISALIGSECLSEEDIDTLRRFVEDAEKQN